MGQEKENSKLEVEEKFLKEFIEYSGRNLVGKIMKRFELFTELPTIKSSVKNLIYEDYRNFLKTIIAHSRGVQFSFFEFKNKSKGLDNGKK